MHVRKLTLINFKNHAEITLDFSAKINCIVGQNGVGKTNILDAIHYMSLTKSAFNTVDSQNIRFDQLYFMIKGVIDREGPKELLCSLQRGKKKIFKVDKIEYNKLSDHVGLFPVVLVAPDDSDIIKGPGEVRRKFFDSIISQVDKKYLNGLVRYNHYLKQRNALLKRFHEGLKFDYDLLLPYDKELKILNSGLSKKREGFMEQFNPIFREFYAHISSGHEMAEIVYDTIINEQNIDHLFNEALEKDRIMERSTVGIHRDEFKFLLDHKPIKKFGSQGQQKSFLLALKVAHYQTILKLKGFKPVLMLDDIFDKLDTERISKVLQIMSTEDFGQIFITDARKERTEQFLEELNMEAKFHFI